MKPTLIISSLIRKGHMDLAKELKSITASLPEQEAEKLLNAIIKGTEFQGKTYSVGGYVRDEILGVDSKDLDVVVEIEGGAEKLSKYLHNQFPEETTDALCLGAGYPIWHIAFKKDITFKENIYKVSGAEVDFADTQLEAFPDPKTRQRITKFGTLKDDIARRDFTVNMMLKDLSNMEYKDLTGTSKNDIEKGILRGHPEVSLDKIFNDDPLRMIRLVRFYCKYGWQIPMSVLRTVKRNADRIKIISQERIRDELVKIMKIGKLHKALPLMKSVGLLKYILPEIDRLKGVEHDKRHHLEGGVWEHVLDVLKHAPHTIDGQLSALLHDVGKPDTQTFLNDKIQFLGHEEVGGEIAEAILKRLKFDNDTVKRIRTMVENHMRVIDLEKASDKALRKFIREVGEEMVNAILDLAEADALGTTPPENYIPELRERFKKIKEYQPVVDKKPILDGNEIMRILNIQPSIKVKEIMKYLVDLEDDYIEKGLQLTKEEAIKKIKEL